MVDKAELIKHLMSPESEGLRLHPYTDTVGKLTIGIGRNLTDNGIRMKEAIFLCSNDVEEVFEQLKNSLDYFDSLPDNVQFVLADMCFNLGIGNLLTFHKSLALIKSGDYSAAGDEILKSKWAKQVGNRAIRLSNMLKK